ncbi:hypothetical protein O181_105111 [Austropuccinia psidii MF-1]|uniref:Uncharacterized protein n=1 Tax=Austropuccinia psidii MF-1 TaxID=1389203 RepID=A0A9Q3JNG9_9BASI|nr:hypothetical protein [Austropuccinia psidii MF-1]
MAIGVNNKCNHCLNLNSRRIQDQQKTYKKKYMSARNFENSMGDRLTEEDESKFIKSNSENLEIMCPFYVEMDSPFGHKPNITPIASYDMKEKDSLNNNDDDENFINKVSHYLFLCLPEMMKAHLNLKGP